MEILKKIAGKFSKLGTALYLIGSASRREEADRVNDLDLVVIVGNSFKLYLVEKFSRDYKKINNLSLPVTYQFWPLELVSSMERYARIPLFVRPAYFTYVRVNSICLGGRDCLEGVSWLPKQVVRSDAVSRVKRAVLSLFKEVNKKRFTKEQNYLVLKYIREIMFNAMYAKFYFGFSKTELFKLFLQEYRLKNRKPARLLYESRRRGRDHFVSQEPRALQDSALLFAQEMWNRMEELK